MAVRLPPLRDRHDREILRLAGPALGALVAEPLFLLADSAIVGRLGTAQLAGLGIAGTVLATVVNLCVFLAYGTTAAVARRVGGGDLRGAIAQGVDGIWLAVLVGVALIAVGLPLSGPVVEALGASPEVAPYALTYLRISLLGLPGMLVVLAGTGVLRGLQDTRTPLAVAVGAASVNLALDLLFVPVLGYGIAGSAWATVIAQTGGAVVYGVVVVRGARQHGAPLRPDLLGIRAAGTAGLPLLVRTFALRVVLVAATVVATRIGDTALAAHQVAFTTWLALALALDAIAIAGQAIVGRCLGAGDAAGARSATRRMVEWGVAAGVVSGLAVLAARPAYVPIFSTDPRVRELLAAALLVVAVHQPVAGAVFTLDGVLIGAGDARYLAVASVATTVAFLPAAAAVLGFGGGLVALWWALGWFLLVRLALLGARARSEAWMVTGAVRR